MIYDCFPFFREVDLLEIRLNTLKDVVDTFVIAELDHTHSGKYKGHIFDKERFSDFPIHYAPLSLNSDMQASSWQIENEHRRYLQIMLKRLDLEATDIVILSDLDEIPRAKLIKEHKFGRYLQDLYYFKLNGYVNQDWHSGTVVMPGITALTRDFQEIRMDRSIPEVENGGWHFSSVGTDADVITKMQSFAHIEYDNEEAIGKVLENIENRKSIHGEELRIEDVELLPKYVRDNLEKFQHLLW